jgi:hypothetical protein
MHVRCPCRDGRDLELQPKARAVGWVSAATAVQVAPRIRTARNPTPRAPVKKCWVTPQRDSQVVARVDHCGRWRVRRSANPTYGGPVKTAGQSQPAMFAWPLYPSFTWKGSPRLDPSERRSQAQCLRRSCPQLMVYLPIATVGRVSSHRLFLTQHGTRRSADLLTWLRPLLRIADEGCGDVVGLSGRATASVSRVQSW